MSERKSQRENGGWLPGFSLEEPSEGGGDVSEMEKTGGGPGSVRQESARRQKWSFEHKSNTQVKMSSGQQRPCEGYIWELAAIAGLLNHGSGWDDLGRGED